MLILKKFKLIWNNKNKNSLILFKTFDHAHNMQANTKKMNKDAIVLIMSNWEYYNDMNLNTLGWDVIPTLIYNII